MVSFLEVVQRWVLTVDYGEVKLLCVFAPSRREKITHFCGGEYFHGGSSAEIGKISVFYVKYWYSLFWF